VKTIFSVELANRWIMAFNLRDRNDKSQTL